MPRPRAVPTSVRTAATGAVELLVNGADLFAAMDHAGQVRVVVGRPGAIAPLEAATALAGANAPTSRWLTVPISLDGR